MPRIQNKRGTSANLASVNPTPLDGELVFDSTENAIKIGDGATAWTSLAYVTATPRTHTHSADAITSGTIDYARLPVGSTSSTVCAGDDARLTDARTPTAHKASHATGGSDALTPGDIGAAPAASPTFTGTATFETVGQLQFSVSDTTGVGLPEWPDNSPRPVIFATSGSGTDFGGQAGHLAIMPRTNQNRDIIFGGGITTTQERMRLVGSNGRLGIGTASPATLLDVAGVITVPAGTVDAPSVTISGDNNTGLAQLGGADTFSIVCGGAERLRAKSNGVIRYVPLTADPASGETGDVYFNSTLNKLRVYNGERWVSLHGAAWDISTARYVQSFSVQAQETAPQSLFFKPDGTKFYVLGSTGDDVNQYDLAVPWDISTATYIQNFSVASEDNVPQGLFFRADGLKMFMVGSQTDAVYEYTLSTAWNLSTATYSLNSFSVAAAETQPTGVFFKPDGTKMFTVGVIDDYVDQYDLSAAWGITSATFSQSHLVSGQETHPHDLCFSPDGTRFFIVGDSGDGVDEYILGTAWDLSGTVTHAQFRSFSGEEDTLRGLAFSPDGTRMYLIGAANDTVIQYSLL